MRITELLPLVLCAVEVHARNPKRGMISDLNSGTYDVDVQRFTSPEVTTLSWYYSFGHYPDSHFSSRYNFTMQQFGIDTTPDSNGNNFKNLNTLMQAVDETRPDHLMTFLEPAISGISVEDAVSAWRKYIIPVRKKYPKMRVGSPSVINGPASLPWIRSFISQCPDCKFDWLDVHYYWTYQSFKGEIEMWHNNFPHRNIWVSDLGFQDEPPSGPECKASDVHCVQRIKNLVTWMDQTDYIKRYTFRGEFRWLDHKTNQFLWSFIDRNGDYTDLGRWYLGIGA